MAINDLVFIVGDTASFIVEIPSTTYTGSLTDINTDSNSGTSALTVEPKVSTVQINKSQRKVR
jgi:hypothetical protein